MNTTSFTSTASRRASLRIAAAALVAVTTLAVAPVSQARADTGAPQPVAVGAPADGAIVGGRYEGGTAQDFWCRIFHICGY